MKMSTHLERRSPLLPVPSGLVVLDLGSYPILAAVVAVGVAVLLVDFARKPGRPVFPC